MSGSAGNTKLGYPLQAVCVPFVEAFPLELKYSSSESFLFLGSTGANTSSSSDAGRTGTGMAGAGITGAAGEGTAGKGTVGA